MYKNVKVHQLDVKNTLLNSELKEDVYLQQLPAFENLDLPHLFYKLEKVVYRWKQATKALFETLSMFLI